MPDASPAKWHMANVSWFFECFVLRDHVPGYAPFDPHYAYLFNSYYEAEGPRHARPMRGMITRPTLEDIRAYHAHVDRALAADKIGREYCRERVCRYVHHCVVAGQFKKQNPKPQ